LHTHRTDRVSLTQRGSGVAVALVHQEPSMSTLTRRVFAPVLLVCALLASACGTSDLKLSESDLSKNDPFLKVSRGALSTATFGADAGAGGLTSANEDTFYVAIHTSQLGQRWFLSAYLTQWHPSENVPMRSLGTKVVSFKVQNGKLFVFDATDGKAWSDVLDPSVVLEAYPVVTNNAEFNALPGANNYVLFDPAAGLNRFNVVGDEFAQSYSARFQVDLTFLRGFKALADGVSWEQVFTGYTEVPGPGILAYEEPFRGSGTLRMTLRRYAESAGFTPSEFTGAMRPYFWSSNWRYAKNEPRSRGYAVKWNIHPGMQPIDWRISKSLETLERDPRLAGIDVRGAITRGVEGWNQAFGFQAFRVVPTSASDSPGDDDKNFIVVDTNPGAGLAFANWRENPNTGEIRGASVYFSSAFVESALLHDGGAPEPEVDAGVPGTDAGLPDTTRAWWRARRASSSARSSAATRCRARTTRTSSSCTTAPTRPCPSTGGRCSTARRRAPAGRCCRCPAPSRPTASSSSASPRPPATAAWRCRRWTCAAGSRCRRRRARWRW
jgi:hypothetical protein